MMVALDVGKNADLSCETDCELIFGLISPVFSIIALKMSVQHNPTN